MVFSVLPRVVTAARCAMSRRKITTDSAVWHSSAAGGFNAAPPGMAESSTGSIMAQPFGSLTGGSGLKTAWMARSCTWQVEVSTVFWGGEGNLGARRGNRDVRCQRGAQRQNKGGQRGKTVIDLQSAVPIQRSWMRRRDPSQFDRFRGLNHSSAIVRARLFWLETHSAPAFAAIAVKSPLNAFQCVLRVFRWSCHKISLPSVILSKIILLSKRGKPPCRSFRRTFCRCFC